LFDSQYTSIHVIKLSNQIEKLIHEHE